MTIEIIDRPSRRVRGGTKYLTYDELNALRETVVTGKAIKISLRDDRNKFFAAVGQRFEKTDFKFHGLTHNGFVIIWLEKR